MGSPIRQVLNTTAVAANKAASPAQTAATGHGAATNNAPQVNTRQDYLPQDNVTISEQARSLLVATSPAKAQAAPAPATANAPAANAATARVTAAVAPATAAPAAGVRAVAPSGNAPPANTTGANAPTTNAPAAAAPAANNGAASAALAGPSMLQLEREVQQLANQGLTAKQIAANLSVSVSTVQLYLQTASPANTTAATATPAATRIAI